MIQLFQNLLNAENERQELVTRIADKLRQLDLSDMGSGSDPMFGIATKYSLGNDRTVVGITNINGEGNNTTNSVVGSDTNVSPI